MDEEISYERAIAEEECYTGCRTKMKYLLERWIPNRRSTFSM